MTRRAHILRAREGQTPRDAARRCDLKPGAHALRRQLQRGISDAEIREAIRLGTLRRLPGRWQSENRTLRVSYTLEPCTILVWTVMYRA